MTADRPLTRRELRELERARETTGPSQVTPAAEPVAPEPEAQDVPAARPTRRALRDAGRDLETTSERAAVRRRPVQPPTTTTGLTVVDAATGAISAVRLGAESAPVPELRAQPVPGPERDPEPASELSAPPAPARGREEAGPEVPLRRRSVMGREADAVPAPADPEQETTPEVGDDVTRGARRSALATILRFLVLLVAALVIGVLIWMVADEAAATEVAVQVSRVGDTR